MAGDEAGRDQAPELTRDQARDQPRDEPREHGGTGTGAGAGAGAGTGRSRETATPPGTRTVADVLRARRAGFTPAQRRVAQVLLGDYPAAGLQSAARLAEAAEVSAPTVVRLVADLGFGGYPQMQDALREELSARGIGPLQAYPADGDAAGAASLHTRAAGLICRAVDESLHSLDPAELDRALDLLADPRRAIVVTGGRFSWVLAAHLCGYLALLRPGVRHVPPEPGARNRGLLDVDPDTTAVVFDYRRYQVDTTAFGREAARRGAALIVCTDPYLSPASSAADVLLTTVVAGPPPFISLAPAFALVETLVAGVTERGGQRARERLAEFEQLGTGSLGG